MKIPPRFEHAKWEDVPDNVRKSLEAMHETRRGLYLHGPVGCGKTHIVAAIAKRVQEKSHYVRFWNAPELLHSIRQDFDKNYNDKILADEDLKNYEGLVVIDDIGAEKISDWVGESFYLIVNKRYEEMRPTIFTSNLSLKELADRIGDRTVSRIAEMCDVIELDGPDKRAGKQNKITIKI